MPNARPSAEEWGKTIYQELRNGSNNFNPIIKTHQKAVIQKVDKAKNNNVQAKTIASPLPQEKGIGAWCLHYVIYPLIGIIMTVIYYAQGKKKKGGKP